MIKKSISALIICLLLICCKQIKNETVNTEYLSANFVIDDSNIFTQPELDSLNFKLQNFEKETSNELVVITQDSIIGDMETYATSLSNSLGIGKRGKDNGLLILLVKPLRSVRISTGKGTEIILTDSICKSIIDRQMTPNFKQDKFYEGVDQAVDELISKCKK